VADLDFKVSKCGELVGAVFFEVPKELLLDNVGLKNALRESLNKYNFTILGELPYEFDPQGYTFLVLLAESHGAIHTNPEHNSISFVLYSCRGSNDAEPIFEAMKKYLGSKNFSFWRTEMSLVKEK